MGTESPSHFRSRLFLTLEFNKLKDFVIRRLDLNESEKQGELIIRINSPVSSIIRRWRCYSHKGETNEKL